jgi:hypothetical protein
MYKSFKTVLTSLGLLWAAGSIQAAGLPHYYPSSFDRQGVISGMGGGELFVNARRYQLDPNVRVHSLATEFASRGALKGGAEIGFTTAPGKQGVGKITEIWLLPDGTVKLP